MAGSSVSAARHRREHGGHGADARGWRRWTCGTISMPTMASTTVMPLKNTALEAVAAAVPMASSFSRPPARSSRYRETMNRE